MQAKKEDCLHSGRLTLTDTRDGVYICWDRDQSLQQQISLNLERSPADLAFSVGSPPDAREWAVIAECSKETPKDHVRFSNSDEISSPCVKFSSSLDDKQLRLEADLSEVRSYMLGEDGKSLTFMMRDGTRHNTLVFIDDGPEEFLALLPKYMAVRKSATNEDLYILTDKKVAALDQSLTELNLFDRSGDTTRDQVWKTIGDMQRDPYTTGLSLIIKMADKLLFSPAEKEYRPEDEMAELLQGEAGGGSLDCTLTQGEAGESLDWQLVSRAANMLGDLRVMPRAAPLCQLDWELHITEDGMVEDVNSLLDKIFRGGVEECIRAEVWKYLLGYYQWHHTHEVRETNRKASVHEYFRMKLQWKSLSEDQENRFAAFRERKTQIEKDVSRTDRSHPFYVGDNNPNVNLLQDILMTYVMYNFDLGYVQGMSDLLSPILYVMQNEVDAFWCFVGFMDRVASNFELEQGGMKRQLGQLTLLLKYLDLPFYNYLEVKESGNLFFCFRWLLIWFKREFSYTDTMTLWEVLWTKKPCKNFHLLICAALLDTERSAIVENKYGFTEILKHVNDLAHRIDLQKALMKAEGIYQVLRQDTRIPDQLANILGLEPADEPAVNGPGDQNTPSSQAQSKPVPINASPSHRERNPTESSNCSSSLNNSSSVEVLSELEQLDEETRFENGVLSSFY